MTKKRFWQIIEQSRRTIVPRAGDNFDRQERELTTLLSALPPDEVVSFNKHFCERLVESYDYTLWDAAYLMGNGCSDDWFDYFRFWLISMGRQVYEQALKNPDSLAEVIERRDFDDFFFEEFSYIPGMVYEQRTGRMMPDTTEFPRKPTGTLFDQDDMEYFERTFPRLWAVFAKTFTRSA